MYSREYDYRLPAGYLDNHRYGRDRYGLERRYDHHHGSSTGRLRPALMPRLSSHRRDIYDRSVPNRYDIDYARDIDPRDHNHPYNTTGYYPGHTHGHTHGHDRCHGACRGLSDYGWAASQGHNRYR